MDRTILGLAALWIGFNGLIAGLLLTRRPRSRLRHALYEWAVSDPARQRPRQFSHSLVVAHRHYR